MWPGSHFQYAAFVFKYCIANGTHYSGTQGKKGDSLPKVNIENVLGDSLSIIDWLFFQKSQRLEIMCV